MNDRFFNSFTIAGFLYYDGIEVFEYLKVGVRLNAIPEPENIHDTNAVALYFENTRLGYIPRECNIEISKFFRLGHRQLFEFRINRVCPEAHSEKQIGVVVKILPAIEKHSIKPAD